MSGYPTVDIEDIHEDRPETWGEVMCTKCKLIDECECEDENAKPN